MGAAQRAELDALKRAHPLEDLVAQTVQLKRVGNTFSGLCPFHVERTPSFYVYPDEAGGHWYCFSAACQRGGDIITFLQLRDGWSFLQALKYLRTLDPRTPSPPSHHRATSPPRMPVDDQRRALQVAVDLYARRLWQTRGHVARDYLAQRGITQKTARDAHLGYCSGEDCAELVAKLRHFHIPVQAAIAIGILDRNARNERFAERIIIPEVRGGQARWMTGRHLREVPEKYLNVHGPRHILGADMAYSAPQIIADEGPMNWLTLCQWRLPAIAFTGGSLPEEGYQWLTAARHIYLPFNRDKAGWAATCRIAPKLEGRAEIICLPARWNDQNINDVNDLERASAEPYEGYRLFMRCGRAALPWNELYLDLDYHDLPIIVPSP